MRDYVFLDEEIWFPEYEYADDNGLLAIGGDLSVERLILAYQNGIFRGTAKKIPFFGGHRILVSCFFSKIFI